jgi:hypothetical protein
MVSAIAIESKRTLAVKPMKGADTDMSIRLMSIVFECSLPTTEKFVLLAMADYASDSGESIFPSIATLARKTSLSDRSVQRSIQSLLEGRYLDMVREGGGRNHTNLYRIRVARFSEEKGKAVTPIEAEELKGDTVSKKGDTVSKKGDAVSPEPSLTIKEPPVAAPSKSLHGEPVYEVCDEYGIPLEQKKKKERRARATPPEQFEVAQALADVTGMSFPANRARLAVEARELLKDDRVSAKLILEEYGANGTWYRMDFRGKKGERPTLRQIRETLFTYKKERPRTVVADMKPHASSETIREDGARCKN